MVEKNNNKNSLKTIIQEALIYYDTNNHIHEQEFKNITFNHLDISKNDVDPSYIELYDRKKKLKKYTCQIIGMYNAKSRYFHWSWEMKLPKSITKISRKMFTYGININLGYKLNTLENINVASKLLNTNKYLFNTTLISDTKSVQTTKGVNTFDTINDYNYQFFLKDLLIRSSFLIPSYILLHILLALTMYLSKIPKMYRFTNGDNKYWYVLLVKQVSDN